VKAGYPLVSKKSKNLDTYKTKAGAEKRECQVQYFKKKKAGRNALSEGVDDY
jgi:hypothetical protein